MHDNADILVMVSSHNNIYSKVVIVRTTYWEYGL